jgi:transposase
VRLEPMIPKASPGGRPRKTDMRAAMNAILYLLRTGCPWRYLPRDGFPPRRPANRIVKGHLPECVATTRMRRTLSALLSAAR